MTTATAVGRLTCFGKKRFSNALCLSPVTVGDKTYDHMWIRFPRHDTRFTSLRIGTVVAIKGTIRRYTRLDGTWSWSVGHPFTQVATMSTARVSLKTGVRTLTLINLNIADGHNVDVTALVKTLRSRLTPKATVTKDNVVFLYGDQRIGAMMVLSAYGITPFLGPDTQT